MTPLRGRVRDARGGSTRGARVFLYPRFTPFPAEPLRAVADARGEYLFRRQDYEAKLGAAPAQLHAVLGDRVSEPVSPTGRDVPDLLLVDGAMGVVSARWRDGEPAAHAPFEIQCYTESAEPLVRHFACVSDPRGECTFGPVPDRSFVLMVATLHPEAVERRLIRDDPPWRPGQPLEVTLTRGRTVRGRLVAPAGRSATDFFVRAWNGELFRAPRAVAPDPSGAFTVAGVELDDGVVAVHARRAVADTPHMQFVNATAYFRADGDDIGDIVVPETGSLPVRIVDADGNPLPGTLSWCPPDLPRCLDSRSMSRQPPDGIVYAQGIPLGVPLDLTVTAGDRRHGKLWRVVRIREASAREITVRVTGEGIVIVRLHPSGRPDLPLAVASPWLESDGQVIGSECEKSADVRGLLGASGERRPLAVLARGYVARFLTDIEIARGGPTYLDVELEPL